MITSLLILVVHGQIGNDLVDRTTLRAKGGKLNRDLHDDPNLSTFIVTGGCDKNMPAAHKCIVQLYYLFMLESMITQRNI
jgi:hypothetical protein